MGKAKLQRGIYARTPEGFSENISYMEQHGKSKKRAVGTAYGEAHLDMDKEVGYDELQSLIKKL